MHTSSTYIISLLNDFFRIEKKKFIEEKKNLLSIITGVWR